MKLHTTLVALFNHKFHGIPIRIGCLSLYTGQKAAPRFQLRSIESIGFGTYLKDNGINACLLQGVQLTDQGLFQLLGGNSAELSVNSLYPGCTKFTFGVSFGLELRCHCQRKEQGTYAQKGSYFHSL